MQIIDHKYGFRTLVGTGKEINEWMEKHPHAQSLLSEKYSIYADSGLYKPNFVKF